MKQEKSKTQYKAFGLIMRYVDKRAWKQVSNRWALKCYGERL